MNSVKHTSKKSFKNINWKLFFNMRIFRYAFLKQLKSISTYVFFCLTIILSILLLYIWSPEELGDNSKKKVIEKSVSLYKFSFHIAYMIISTFFIAFKSLQIFRDEMDDGTLLVFSSMPFTRIKLVIQKLLSLQVICLIFTLSVVFISSIIFLSTSGFSTTAWEMTKCLYKKSLGIFIASIIFQILISPVVVLISLYAGKVGTIGFSGLFSSLLIVMFFVPQFIGKTSLKHGETAWDMNWKLQQVNQNRQSNWIQYYKNKDSDLKEFFELENWFIDQEFVNRQFVNPEQFEFTFQQSTINELHDILSNPSDNNIKQKRQNFLKKEFNVEIALSSSRPKAVKEILNLFNQNAPKIINLRAISVNKNVYHRKDILDEHDRKVLFKFKDIYNALDNNNFTEKERKIVQLSKSLLDDFDEKSALNVEMFQYEQGTKIFSSSLAKQYAGYYDSIAKLDYLKEKITELLKNGVEDNKSIAYFINDLAFQNLSFLMKNLFKNIVDKIYIILNSDFIDVKEQFENYLKSIKVNNYLNIMTQIGLIWNDQVNNLPVMIQNFLPNCYGEWEKIEKNYIKKDGKKVEYLKIKLESLKTIITPTLLCIVYPFISLSLVSLISFMIYKRDFI